MKSVRISHPAQAYSDLYKVYWDHHCLVHLEMYRMSQESVHGRSWSETGPQKSLEFPLDMFRRLRAYLTLVSESSLMAMHRQGVRIPNGSRMWVSE